MKVPNTLPQFIAERALIVVSAKEQGRLYQVTDGVIEEVVKVEEHPEQYSDREGFFFRSGYGRHYGSGSPLEEHTQENIRQFVSSIAVELNDAIATLRPDVLYFFQPDHLKGYLTDAIINPTHIPMHTPEYGNFVDETPLELLARIQRYHDDSIDPTDPASVADGPRAEEARRLLSRGKQ